MREMLALACGEVAGGEDTLCTCVGLAGPINSETRRSVWAVIETRRPPWMTRTYFIVRTVVPAVGYSRSQQIKFCGLKWLDDIRGNR